MSARSVVVFDFDNTLTTTDTIKIVVLSLLLRFPWRIFRTVFLYKKCKKSGVTSEILKHSVIGALIAGRSALEIAQCMKLYRIVVRRVIFKSIWREMLQKRDSGEHVVVATASPRFAVASFMQQYTIAVIGTEYQIRDGVFTGLPEEPIPFGKGKMQRVRRYMQENGMEDISAVYTDSLTDLPVLRAAQRGFIVKQNGVIEEFHCST